MSTPFDDDNPFGDEPTVPSSSVPADNTHDAWGDSKAYPPATFEAPAVPSYQSTYAAQPVQQPDPRASVYSIDPARYSGPSFDQQQQGGAAPYVDPSFGAPPPADQYGAPPVVYGIMQAPASAQPVVAAPKRLAELQKASLSQSPYESVTISDPEKADTYIVYKLVTTYKDGKRVSVTRRRYNDFHLLYQVLVTENPGLIVPPPPEKKLFGRFNADFVETRRQLLEGMMRRILTHPLLVRSEAVSEFLSGTESFESFVAAHGQTVKSGFSELVDKVLPEITALLKGDDEDPWFAAKKKMLTTTEGQIRGLARRVENLASARRDVIAGDQAFWEALTMLSEAPDSTPAFAPLLSLAAPYMATNEAAARTSLTFFGNMLHEHLRFFESIHSALLARDAQFDALQSAQRTLQNRKNKLDKMMGAASKSHLVTQTVREVEESQQQVDRALAEFEDITAVVKLELEKFETTIESDMKKAVQSFIMAAVTEHRAAASKWEALLTDDAKEAMGHHGQVDEGVGNPF